jgi:hypothetical protein
MFFTKKSTKTFNKIALILTATVSFVSMATGTLAFAQWPNAAENQNCTGPTANKACSSISRFPGSNGEYGTATDEWKSSDRSLNIDTWYSYNIEDGRGLNTYQNNNNIRDQKMSPGAGPNQIDAQGNMLFCASEMFYNINTGGNTTGITDVNGTPQCGNKVRKALKGTVNIPNNFPTITYGPAITSLVPDQVYQVDFRIKVENIDVSVGMDDPVFTFSKIGLRNDNYFGTNNNIVYKNNIKNSDYNTYSLLFKKDPNVLNDEFRVFTHDNSDISVDTITIKEADAPLTWNYLARNYTNFLVNNENVMDGEDVVRTCNKKGFCLLAINSTDNTAGGWYSAKFSIKAENISAADSKAAVELIVENVSQNNIGTLNKSTHIVTQMNSGYTDYELIYYKPNDAGLVDYRVRLTNDLTSGRINIKEVKLTEISKPASITQTYQSEFQSFLNGTVVQDGQTLAVSNSTKGIATFGPSVNSLPSVDVTSYGNYTANFYVKNSGGANVPSLFRLDASNYNGYTVSRTISTSQYNAAQNAGDAYKIIPVDFQRLDLNGRMHFRLVNLQTGNEIRVDKVQVVNK